MTGSHEALICKVKKSMWYTVLMMPTGCPCSLNTFWTLIKMVCRLLGPCWLMGGRCMYKSIPEARTIVWLRCGRSNWTTFACFWKTNLVGRVKSTLLCFFTTARFLPGCFQPNFLPTTCVYCYSHLQVPLLSTAFTYVKFQSFLCIHGSIGTLWLCSRSAHLETWSAITLWQFNFACLSRWVERIWVAVGTVELDLVAVISLLDLEVFWVERFKNVLVFCTFVINSWAIWSSSCERSYYAEI